jgi:AcrR family transcriptional regulator
MEITDKIKTEAASLFLRYGIKSITMDDIARSLGISKKTIYQSYKDKNEIVLMVARDFLDSESGRIRKIYASKSNAIEKLTMFSAMMRETFTKINANVLFDLKKYYPDAWNYYLSFKQDVFYKSILQLLSQGIEEGFFRKELNTEVIAKIRLEQVQWIFDDQIFPPDHFNFKDVQIQIFDHFIYGIVTPKGYKLLEKHAKNNLSYEF